MSEPSGLTARQQKILAVITEFTAIHGYAPSIRQIRDGAGYISTSGIAHQLIVLERQGHLTRVPGLQRTVQVTATQTWQERALAAEARLAEIRTRCHAGLYSPDLGSQVLAILSRREEGS
jgi:repressor LexA